LTHHLWTELSQQIHSFLNGISLADLMKRTDVQKVARLQRNDCNRPVIIKHLT
jgi:Rrf2 family iron-sulfur cluster assembly transcriptional regulator